MLMNADWFKISTDGEKRNSRLTADQASVSLPAEDSCFRTPRCARSVPQLPPNELRSEMLLANFRIADQTSGVRDGSGIFHPGLDGWPYLSDSIGIGEIRKNLAMGERVTIVSIRHTCCKPL